MGPELDGLSDRQLLHLYAEVMDKLKDLGIIRSGNNPVSDYAEYLVSKRLGLDQTKCSEKGVDAIGPDKTKYQIKARRLTRRNSSRQLGIIRDLNQSPPPFDFCVAVLFNEYFEPIEAYRIPVETVSRYARHSEYQNGHVLTLSPPLIRDPSVENILERLRAGSPVELDSGQGGLPTVSRAML